MAEDKDLTCERIVEAARRRFSHYGYAKTTMAEIAGDCGMSPGNLYRFFPGKLDIAEAIMRADEKLRLAELERIVAAPAMNARERLKAYFSSELRSTYAKFENEPHTLEIAHIISERRPDFGNNRVAVERGMIERILSEGTRAGAFNVSDSAYTAALVHSAMLKFRFPQRWTHAPLATLERELEGVLKLILDGLTPRAEAVA